MLHFSFANPRARRTGAVVATRPPVAGVVMLLALTLIVLAIGNARADGPAVAPNGATRSAALTTATPGGAAQTSSSVLQASAG
ncbi:MAG TPA: hypothetical protein VFR41_11565, partial [Acidimicrobiia bacterium]|nr:hypothetical protein [Acidimicrobiia bacterium]